MAHTYHPTYKLRHNQAKTRKEKKKTKWTVIPQSTVDWGMVAELYKARVDSWVILAMNIKDYSIQDFVIFLHGFWSLKV